MTPNVIRAEIIAEKISYIRRMVDAVHGLPLSTFSDFSSDPRNAAAGESYLRRALEALFDLGRHILAKGFGKAPTEYKEIVAGLQGEGILSEEESRILKEMAGYRNRMVHFYNEIQQEELYTILSQNLPDVEMLSDAIARWLGEHPEKLESRL